MKKLCSKCGNALGENAKFCGKCGTKYEENECQECRGSLQKGMQFCSACGKELNTEKDSSTKQFVEKSISEMSEDINQTNEQGGKKAKLPLLKIIPILIFAIVVYNVFLNPTNSPEAAVALQVAKNDMGSGFSESDIKFDVIAAKDDSKFIVKCKANSSEAEEMYELVYATDVCYYGIEFGNGVGEYFTTIGDSEADVKDKNGMVGVLMSKYCEQCGTELEDNMKFCPKCGTSCDVSTVVSENAEESKKNKLLFEKKRKKRVVFSICGILFMLAVLSGVGGSDENSENKKSVQQLTLEEFIEKDNEIYGEGIRVEDLITNNEGDYILGKDFIDEFVDSGNYTYYYYDNGVAKDRNNQEEVNLALAVQASGKQRNFEILVEESGKIKAIQSSFKDGDFAKAQNLMKIFVPTSEMEDYPKLKDKARKNAIAYDYRDGVVIEVTKNFIRLWYDTVENYEIYSKQQLLSEEEERGIIGETLGVWEQEERWDLPILDITMPSDDKLLIKQYYSEGVDEYGNELFSQKECEVNISDKEYADFSKNIEYKITNQKNEEVILQLVLTQERTIKYTLPQEKSLECIKYLYDEREVAYKKTNKEMFDTTGAQEADFSAEQGSIEGDFSEEFQIENDEPYIFPQSNYEFVEQSELWEYSKEEIVLARNEIFARHGRIFNNENIRQYFESKDWYCGTIDPEEFDNNMDSILNEYEKANIETFKFVEEIKNQRGNP